MSESPESLPSSVPVRVDEVKVTDRGVEIRGTLPPGFTFQPFPVSIADVEVTPRGVDWGKLSLWEHRRDTALLARGLEDLAGLTTQDAEALAAALRPLDGAGVEPAELVSRADLRRLVARAQEAGPEMSYAWSVYRDAGAERLTAWQAFRAGLRAAAEWRRA